jgi:hypothetical protein
MESLKPEIQRLFDAKEARRRRLAAFGIITLLLWRVVTKVRK